MTFEGKKVTFNFIYLLLLSETYTDTNDETSHLDKSLGKQTNSKPSMEPNQEMQFPDRSATWNGFTLRLDVVPVYFNATKKVGHSFIFTNTVIGQLYSRWPVLNSGDNKSIHLRVWLDVLGIYNTPSR